jgi:hypothetical protein
VQSGENQSTFRRKLSPPSSRSKKPAWGMRSVVS